MIDDLLELGVELGAEGAQAIFKLGMEKIAEFKEEATKQAKRQKPNNKQKVEYDYDHFEESYEYNIEYEFDDKPEKDRSEKQQVKVADSVKKKEERVKPQQELLPMARLQEGIAIAEILGAPVCKKRRNRMGRV